MYNYAYLHWDLVKIKRLKYRQKLSSNSTVTNTYVMISVKTTWQRDSSLLSVRVIFLPAGMFYSPSDHWFLRVKH